MMRNPNVRQQTLSHFGIEYRVIRNGQESHTVVAKDATDREGASPRKYLMLLTDADVQVDDEVVNTLTDERAVIEDVVKKTAFGHLHGLDAYYVDEREAKRREEEAKRAAHSAAPSFSVGTNYGIVGTQAHAQQTQTFDMRAVEAEIERRGVDVEELRQLVRELERLTAGEEMPRGALAQFSGALEKHSWLTGSLAGAVLGYLTR
jgi:hypothetical protein